LYIKRLFRERRGWQLFAACTDRGDCQLLEFLSSLPPNQRASGKKLWALFDRASQEGTRNLPDDVCHQIGDGIWEFIKGRLRILWFYDRGQIIICSHGFVKDSKQTPASEITRAEKVLKRYLVDKAAGRLIEED
jgi:phage-related protein